MGIFEFPGKWETGDFSFFLFFFLGRSPAQTIRETVFLNLLHDEFPVVMQNILSLSLF